MQRAFQLLEQIGDAVDFEALAKAEIERRDGEGNRSFARLRLEAGPQGVVDDGAERTASRPHGPLEARCDVIVKGQRGSCWHIMKPRYETS